MYIREGGGFCQSKLWQDQLLSPLASLISSMKNEKWLQLEAELLLKKNQSMAFHHRNNSFRNEQWEFYVPLFLQLTCERDKGQHCTAAVAAESHLVAAPATLVTALLMGTSHLLLISCCLQGTKHEADDVHEARGMWEGVVAVSAAVSFIWKL